MKSKISKIKYIVWACEIALSCFILLILFFTQILLLNQYYEYYKTKMINQVAYQIINSRNLETERLEDIGYQKGICISVYSNDSIKIISNAYNKGCIMSNNISSNTFVKEFIESGNSEQTFIITNNRFNNKNIVKAIKFDDDTYIFLNSSIEALDSSIDLLKSQYIYICIMVFSLSIIIGYVISTKLSLSISEISKSANKMASGDFSVSFKNDSKIFEIRELSETLDKARIELSKTDELRRDLMANVGHDLKTPLTMIKAYAEMTRDLSSQSRSKKIENLNVIIEETDRLALLVNDILDLSKIQSKTATLKIEEFDLNDLIKKIIKRYDILVEKESYDFVYDNKSPLMVKADKTRIEQVIYNLMNNAVNYTGKDKKVIINVAVLQKGIKVEVTDTGKGIKKEEIKVIWDKYYHNEKKHKRNSHGTGLGLSIVKSILEQHKYEYGVKSIEDKGTTFYFIINK